MRLVTEVVVPVPVKPTGLIVQFPVRGRPFSTTVPVRDAQDGCVTRPNLGVAGVPGGEIITTSVEGRDIHPAVVVTLKL
jgi:hypothetical protein